MEIRPATQNDAAEIWQILAPVIRAGEVFALPRDMPEAAALSYWLGPETFVAEDSGQIVGRYYLRANQQGGGAHIANCGYLTAAAAAGRGIARAMCEHSQAQARLRGFKGMQFNFVISSNERAVRLWQSQGFETLARMPGVFSHPALGYVDALVMFKAL